MSDRMTMLEKGGKKYIHSQNIKVFPCAYRGYEDSTTGDSLVFDPEARSTTESNFTNTFHKISNKKESYVVSWTPDSTNPNSMGTLKCVIGGYYFEIYNYSASEFFVYNKQAGSYEPYHLGIKTTNIYLGTSEGDASRQTQILSSFWEENETYLDTHWNADGTGPYVFTGLILTTDPSSTNVTASLQPFICGTGPDGTSTIYKVNPSKLAVTAILDVGSGEHSIQITEGASDSTATEASGDYSVALGKGTKTSGVGAVALGNNTEASGVNAIALGSNTKAEAANQVVVGAYNTKDDTQAFIIANGTSGNPSNKFTVSYTGDVKALGTLETKGSISATGDRTNELVLGTENENSCGSITVYGTAESDLPVFKVENSGNTTISGSTHITNDTQSDDAASGALKVTGGVGIVKNLNVGEALTVAGATTLNNTLTVKQGKLTTLGGALKVARSTTLEDKLEVQNSTTLKGTLGVANGKATTLGGTLGVIGATTLNDTLTVEKLTTLKAGAKSGVSTADSSDAKTLTTKDYVDTRHAAATTYTDEKINTLVGTTATAEEENGEYVQSVTQTEGVISTTKYSFQTTINDNASTANAPTSFAVKKYVDDTAADLWRKALTYEQTDSTTKQTLKTLVLNAAYPIGSIYIHQGSVRVVNKTPICPLEDTLGGNWELITPGTFLCAATNEADQMYTVGNTDGSADAAIINHTHAYIDGSGNTLTQLSVSVTTNEAGQHAHSITSIKGSKTGKGAFTGFDPNAGDSIQWNPEFSTEAVDAHTHSFSYTYTLPALANPGGGEAVTNRNLPPYRAVYMWKRVMD